MPRRSGFAPARSAPAGRAVVPYVCAVAWLAACTPDLAVPATAHVGCRSDADCPSGFLCATSLGRCVQLVGRDTVPPALDGDAAVDPPRGRAGTAFRVRFMVSEPLSEPPEVVARTGDGAASRTAAFAQESGDGTSFAYAWTAKDTDPEGTWTAGIAMLDAGGNRAAAPGGTFVLDRTPPGIVPGSGRAEPQVAAAGAHVAVEFAVADADTTPVEVRVGANSAAFLSQEGARCSYEYVVAQDDPDGTATATAHLKDSAGNEADVDVASFEVDRTAPTVAQAPTLPARPLHAGEAVALVIGFSEAVGDAPAPAAPLAVRMESGSASVTLARTSLGSGQWSAQWSFLHVVEEADRGRWTLWLRNAADRAGNAIAAQRLGELDVDTVPPGMSAGPVLQRSGWFAAGDTVRVMFTPDEEAQAWVSLSVAGISVEMTPEEGADGYARVYSHAVAADDPQGEAEVVVRLSDRALNAGGPWRVAGLALDTVAPTVGDVQVAPAIMVAARTNLVVTAFADDVLASARVESQPALSFPAPVLSGRQALWNYLVSPADESRDYLLTVRVVDRAGNESGPADAIVRFDTRPPQALHVAMEGSPARDGTLLRVRFEASENLLGTPEVTMGDAPMDLDSATDRRYAFSHRAAEAEGSGVRDVAVRMRDPAGNETETLLGRATYDFDRPVVAPADVHVAPASPVGIGAVLSIAATADEALDSARVEATPSLDPGDAIISGRTARWARSVSGADAPGKRTFTIRVSDLAGNESDSITAEAVLDTVPPAISGGVVSGSPARAGTTVRVEFDVSEDVAAPRAILGSAPMQPDAAATSGRHFAFVRVAAPEDGDGTRDATVEVADAAGNAGRARLGSVVFDFTPPRLRASDVAVWPANPVGLGASLSVSVGSDEPLSRAGLAAMPVLDFGAPIVSLDGASWSHSVAASDASGSYELHVAIKDLAGNESSLTLATPIVLDTVRPQVTGAVVRGSPARAGSLISVEFDVSEDLPSPPSVTVGATAMTLDSAHSTARHYVFAHTAAASEVSGVKPVQISVADAAGNVTVAAPGQVVCDFEAPIMSAVAVTPDSPVGLGANLVITATTDEALGPEAALETTPSLPFGAAVISGRSAIWSHVLAGSDLSGTLSVDRLVVHDLAGNETTIARPSAAVLDTAAPALLQGYSVEGSPARDGSPIRATFDVSEAPAGVPSVRIGTVPMTPNTELSTETHFVFDQTAAAAEGDGIKEVRASLVDAAGNGLSTMLGTVVYDFTPPGESPAGNGIRASTTLAGIGTLLRITADFDEPIQTATLDAGEGPSFGAAIVAGRQVVWTRLVAAGDPQGPFGATVRVTDAADNAYERTVATLAAVDSAPPVFVPGATVTPDLPAARGTPIAARFSTGEALPVPPAVRVGGTAMTLSSESTSTSFVYTHTPGDSDDDASNPRQVVATIADAAGNSATTVLGQVSYDFTPPAESPAESGISASPEVAGIGLALVVSAAFDEAVGTATLGGCNGMVFDGPTISGSRVVWSHVVAPGDPEGPFDATVTATDLAGNEYSRTAVSVASVDSAPPETPQVLEFPFVPLKRSTTFWVSVGAAEQLASHPTVTVGGVAMTLVSGPTLLNGGPGESRRYSYTTQPADSEGVRQVIAVLRDAAGNATTSVLGQVTYDFTPPDIKVSVTPARTGKGRTLTVLVSAVELLAPATGTLSIVSPSGLSASSFVGPVVAGNTASWSHAVTDSDPAGSNLLRVTASVSDQAGNFASASNELDAWIDPTLPAVTASTLVQGPLMRGATASATFSSSESLSSAPAFTIGGFSGTATGSGTNWSLSHVVSTTDTEGAWAVQVTLADPAANTNVVTLGVATYDFTPPAVSSATVAYVPASDNPLAVVAQARRGTQIVITTMANETLGTSLVPALTLQCGSAKIADNLAAASVAAGAATFQVTVPTSLSYDGACTSTVKWKDVAGNQADAAAFSSPAVKVKTSTPALSVDHSTVAFLRSPWGAPWVENLGTAFQVPAGPYFALSPPDPLAVQATLPASTFTMTGGALTRVRIWGDTGRTILLGTVPANADGSWPRQQLAGMDVPHAYASGVDDAGNESAGYLVRNAEWVATPNPPVYGYNPHSAAASGLAATSRAPDGQTTALSIDGSAVLARGEPVWRRRTVSSSRPSPRYLASMTWDAVRGRAVLFGGGGDSAQAAYQDTWEWDGTAWLERTPVGTKPAVRSGTPLAFDSARGRALLFGGLVQGGYSQETWEWDGAAWSPVQPSTASRPDARLNHALVHDSGRRRMVLFGGYTSPAYAFASDTWEWDGSAWLLRATFGPPARAGHAMAYDSARGRTVLFGGCQDGYCSSLLLSDTWEWDGTRWYGPFNPGTRPQARGLHSMAYDAARGRTVLFGGKGGAGNLRDTWEWDGKTWVERTPASGGPDSRYAPSMAWDAQRRRTVLFAGWTTSLGCSQDLWEWDGSAWTERAAGSAQPAERYRFATAHDSARARTVVYGGTDNRGNFWRDTWEWDGSVWQNRTPATSPSATVAPAMAFDSARGVGVLFGGQQPGPTAETWEWNGSAWSGPFLPATKPEARAYHAMAYDAARARTVVFGGQTGSGTKFDNVWEWDGAAWYGPFTPATRPGARSQPAMAFDPQRRRTVLFGGEDASYASKGDVWEWDGAAWYGPFQPSTRPASRTGHSMAWDPARARVVLWGGYRSGTLSQDLWEWDGAAWTQRTPSGANPPARTDQGLAWDVRRGLGVLFGGRDATNFGIGDTWELDSGVTQRPAAQFTANAAAAGFGPSDIAGMRVRAHAGGTSASGNGATLLGWAAGGSSRAAGAWAALASVSLGSNASAPYLTGPRVFADWTAPSAAEAQRYMTDRDRTLAFQVRPSGSNGPAGAQTALGYMEIRLQYGGNLLANPGFENGSMNRWTYRRATGTQETGTARTHSGRWSVHLAGPTQAGQYVQGPFAAGQTVDYVVWTLPKAGTSSRVDLAGDSWYDQYGASSAVGDGTTWQRLGGQFNLPRASAYVLLSLVADTAAVEADFDDAWLVVNTPATAAAGTPAWNPPASCKAALDAGGAAGDGVYWIAPDGNASNAFQVYCDMTTEGGGWTMVFKISRGIGGAANTVWQGSALNETNAASLGTDAAPGHYLSRIVPSFWNAAGFGVAEARVNLYSGGALQKYLKFDASGTDRTGWFALSRLVASSWTDLASATPNFFSIDGDTSQLRNWFVNASYAGCSADQGWLAATAGGCAWETSRGAALRLLYSGSSTRENWTSGSVGQADALAVFVR